MTTKELVEELKVCTKYYEKNHKVIRDVSTPISYFLLKEVIKRLEELDGSKESPMVRLNKRKGEFKGVFPNGL